MMWFDDETEKEEDADIEDLRSALRDYYGTAMQQFPMAAADLAHIDSMSDAEIIHEARKAGLI